MSFRYSILFVFLVSIGYVSRGQSSRDVGVSAPKPVYQAHKVSNKRSVFFRKMFKKKELSEEEKFRKRLSKVYKEKAKEQKKYDKPQYTDPAYFGHKRPPKKRPPEKMRFCKECGLRH